MKNLKSAYKGIAALVYMQSFLGRTQVIPYKRTQSARSGRGERDREGRFRWLFGGVVGF